MRTTPAHTTSVRRGVLWAAVGLLLCSAELAAQTLTIRVRPIWASGEIARVEGADGKTRTFVVRQGAHVMTFRVGPDTRFVRERERAPLDGPAAREPVEVPARREPVDVRALREHVGRRVKISYTIVSGSRVALRVVVTESTEPDP